MAENGVRLAELLTALSLAIDIGLGLPMQTMQRAALVATRLAAASGATPDEAAAAFRLALLRFIGCTSTSHTDSVLFGGDELAVAELMSMDDEEAPAVIERAVGAGKPPAERAEATARFFGAVASGALAEGHRLHCEAARIIAGRVGLGTLVALSLDHIYERWDGRGSLGLAGEAISMPMRIVHVATLAAQASPGTAPAEMAARVAARGGRQFDPRLAAIFADEAGAMLEGLDAPDLGAEVLAAEPGQPERLRDEALDRALAAAADFGDFKSPHMLGHSRRVAALAEAAARAASMPAGDIALLRRAALVHDLGRVGVQAQLLSKRGPLTPAEHERIRLHPYLTERIFAASPALQPVGALGALHHERMDGSGYHRGLGAPALSANARLLAAANAWCALTEPRPHRPRLSEPEAARALAAEASSGRLDGKAVDAVLTAAGQRPASVRRAAGIGLSAREIEVLRLVCRQHTNRQVAAALGISAKTVEHHVTHIYDKLGVATRAGAALCATENGLL